MLQDLTTIEPGTEVAFFVEPVMVFLYPPGRVIGGWVRAHFRSIDERCEPHWLVFEEGNGTEHHLPVDDILQLGVVTT